MFQQAPFASLVFLLPMIPITIWVCWSDLSRMKIPNTSVLATLGVFAVTGPFALEFTDYLWRYTHFGVMIVAGFIAAAIRLMGAGDAKFIAAAAPFIALADAFDVVIILAVVTLVSLILHRIARRISWVRARTPEWESWRRETDFPMGFALAPTLIVYLAWSAFF